MSKQQKAIEEIKSGEKVNDSIKFQGKNDFDKGNYEFGFRFVEGMKIIEECTICGTGETESLALTNAREKADFFSNGRYTVVYTGQFKVKL